MVGLGHVIAVRSTSRQEELDNVVMVLLLLLCLLLKGVSVCKTNQPSSKCVLEGFRGGRRRTLLQYDADSF